MRTYKSKKTTASWRSCRLKDFCEKRTAKNVDKKYNSVLTNSAIYGVIKQEEYFEKEVANDENTGTYYIVNPKDFIYNPRISENAPYGPIRANETGEAGIVSPLYFVFGISDSTGVDYDFLKYYFTSSNWHQYIYSIGNNGARCDRMNIADADFMNMTINLPPLAEQKRIAEILGCCDRMIALKKELIAEKKRQKKALMQKLLDPDSDFRLPGFVGEWQKAHLGDFIELVSGVDRPTKSLLTDNKYTPYLTGASNIESSNLILNRWVIHPKNIALQGDILIVCKGSGVGRMVIMNIPRAHIARQFMAIRSSEKVVTKYIYYILKDSLEKIKKEAQGLIVGFDRQTILRLEVVIPSKGEQQIIVDILSAADKEIDLLEQELEQQQQKKKSLMQLLLTGIVRV